MRGQVEGLGATPRLQAAKPGEAPIDQTVSEAHVRDHASALATILSMFQGHVANLAVIGVGHRIRHIIA
jgi:hypothetical protein